MKERKETKLNDGQWWSWSCDANEHRSTSAIRACRTCELPLQLSGGRLAMSARAKERAKDTPPILREKELPPSASNPSAAMNVGEDEAQLMGSERRRQHQSTRIFSLTTRTEVRNRAKGTHAHIYTCCSYLRMHLHTIECCADCHLFSLSITKSEHKPFQAHVLAVVNSTENVISAVYCSKTINTVAFT